jgi:hypothetical protein
MKSTPAVRCALAAALAAAGVRAQQQQPSERVALAAEKWLATDHTSEELLDKTVAALMLDESVGIAWLGEHLPAALKAPAEPRSKGLQALATHVALAFLKRQTTAEYVFAGQYDPLKPLQPLVGDEFFGYLIDTPSWYPDTHRIHLVPALRDLQPTLPEAARVDSLIALAENEAEPENLRVAIGCMLWQWGKKQFVQPQLDKLMKASAEGDAEDRVHAFLELAELQYQLRDYKAAAATHKSLQSLAAQAHYALKPNDWYSAACVNALCGNVDRGIEALQKCADLQASPDVDSSHKMQRATFEKDPEIAVLRRDPRYAAIFAKAFGAKAPGAATGR